MRTALGRPRPIPLDMHDFDHSALAAEAAFPRRACDVPLAKLKVLVSQMNPVLEQAIAARGATLKDGGYQDIFGAFGEYSPLAYGNTGQPCGVCETLMERGVLGPGKSARSFHFCPKCQQRNSQI